MSDEKLIHGTSGEAKSLANRLIARVYKSGLAICVNSSKW